MAEWRCYAGRSLRSAVPLPALPTGQPVPSPFFEVRLATPAQGLAHKPSRRRWLHDWTNPDGSIALQLARMPTPEDTTGVRYILRAPRVCDFHIDPAAGSIQVDPLCDLEPNTLEHLLVDQALPRLLAHRGHLMMHASQVRVGAETVLFLGRSGWGKSTLAGLLHQRGHLALCDDCVLLERRDGHPFGTPSYPGLRLYDDSIAQVAALARHLTPVAEYSEKQRVIGLDIPLQLLTTQPIRAIYLLSNPEQAESECRIHPMAPANACMALVEHSFRLDPTTREHTRQLLEQTAAITRATPTFGLVFPRDFDRQDELVDRILDHLQSLRHTTP